jgi:hypothetical protein
VLFQCKSKSLSTGRAHPTGPLPAWIDIGSGKYADDFGVNLWGLALCTAGHFAGAAIARAQDGAEKS